MTHCLFQINSGYLQIILTSKLHFLTWDGGVFCLFSFFAFSTEATFCTLITRYTTLMTFSILMSHFLPRCSIFYFAWCYLEVALAMLHFQCGIFLLDDTYVTFSTLMYPVLPWGSVTLLWCSIFYLDDIFLLWWSAALNWNQSFVEQVF